MCAPGGCWDRIRNSPVLIIIIVFLSLLTDSLLLTLVDPILPDILSKLEPETANVSLSAVQDINTNGQYGYLVAAKGAAQFVFNPFVGLIVTRFGYRRPMLLGDMVLLVSTVAFAYGANYAELFVTRLFQGLSSSVTAVTGLGLLASTYTNDQERGKVMGIAIGGLSLGIIIGPVYGSVLYQFFGREVPFLALGGMVGLVIVLQLVTLKADSGTKDHSMSSLFKLLTDKYILIVAGNIFLLNLDVSIILAFLPMRLIELENPDTWKLGIVVLPTSIGYLVASLIFPRTTHFFPRWLCALIGLIISTGTLVGLVFSTSFNLMLITTSFLGVALGMVSTSMQPIFAHLVDLRHTAVYGNVYAISDMSVCLAMFLGPLVGGPVVYQFGFDSLVYGAALINVCFAPFSILLRNPKARSPEERSKLTSESDTIAVDSSSSGFEDETTPLLISSSSYSDLADLKQRSLPTMDLSSTPTPRYIEYLSGLEDIYSSDGEALDLSKHSW